MVELRRLTVVGEADDCLASVPVRQRQWRASRERGLVRTKDAPLSAFCDNAFGLAPMPRNDVKIARRENNLCPRNYVTRYNSRSRR